MLFCCFFPARPDPTTEVTLVPIQTNSGVSSGTLTLVPPVNTKYDIEFYVVSVYLNNQLRSSLQVMGNTFATLSFGFVERSNGYATVSTVSTCDKVSDDAESNQINVNYIGNP